MNTIIDFKPSDKYTSLRMATITGKQHSHILRDINDEIMKLGAEIGQSIFGQSYYINAQGKKTTDVCNGQKGVVANGSQI